MNLQLTPFGITTPALVSAAGTPAATRFLEFFASAIRNPHTRRAYARAVSEFLAWYERAGVGTLAAPTVKQRLAAVRHIFDWLVTGQVVATNPAASVRGPSHSARRGKTPVLDATEARQLLDAINVGTPARAIAR